MANDRSNFFFNVLALENILVALNREIGDGPCFLYIEFSWIGVIYFVNFKLTGRFHKSFVAAFLENLNFTYLQIRWTKVFSSLDRKKSFSVLLENLQNHNNTWQLCFLYIFAKGGLISGSFFTSVVSSSSYIYVVSFLHPQEPLCTADKKNRIFSAATMRAVESIRSVDSSKVDDKV